MEQIIADQEFCELVLFTMISDPQAILPDALADADSHTSSASSQSGHNAHVGAAARHSATAGRDVEPGRAAINVGSSRNRTSGDFDQSVTNDSDPQTGGVGPVLNSSPEAPCRSGSEGDSLGRGPSDD